tara:strand:- start:96 stop:503 length:408 start_codon:yes stop_codon:yes gene_type:complete
MEKIIKKMNELIIDAVKENIFFTFIGNKDIYNVCHKNSKTNYEQLMTLIIDFLSSKNLDLKEISSIYVNRGPGSFAGIRNSISIAKALHLAQKIDYYCFSFRDFKGEHSIKLENIPNLCDKFKVKKNLINPVYLS